MADAEDQDMDRTREPEQHREPDRDQGTDRAGIQDPELRARKERERDELYSLDISGVAWHCAPGTEEDEERVEIAYLPAGAVAMRSSLDPDTVLRYTEAEWRAFVLGARDGEFDLETAPGSGGA